MYFSMKSYLKSNHTTKQALIFHGCRCTVATLINAKSYFAQVIMIRNSIH
jgi:hypothetical protein